MLGLQIQVHLEIADSVAAVRQERDRLVHLHSPRLGVGFVSLCEALDLINHPKRRVLADADKSGARRKFIGSRLLAVQFASIWQLQLLA
jgi:hypothetical protein